MAIASAISWRLGMAPSLWARSRLTLRIAVSLSLRCTGKRIVRDWQAIARVMLWRIHQKA
jgi:hypothetical protein